jgi:ribulose 1,5-bisphosphate synthetase/thiazole synthase
MLTTTDAVIVGAGHNGLVAANLLADAAYGRVVRAINRALYRTPARPEVTC